MNFRNEHLSYSRLTRFEQCPLSLKLHYIEKRQAEPGTPLRFGKLMHAVLGPRCQGRRRNRQRVRQADRR